MTGAMVLLSGNALVFIEEMLLQGVWILLAEHQIFPHLQVRESLLHPKRFDEKKRPSHPRRIRQHSHEVWRYLLL